MTPSLHAQASAVDVASQFVGRSPPKMSHEQIEMQTKALQRAARTLMLLQAMRARLPADVLAEIEG